MLHLGTIGGTTIRVEPSFLFIAALWVAYAYNPELGMRYALLWLPILFISVLIHELAHAAVIALFGYGASDVVLGGMGGVTMNRRKARPAHDLFISIAGPLASFGLAWLVRVIFYRVSFAHSDPMLQAFLPMLAQANIWWGVFNLLPISPLDGGHAVRNFLRIFLKEKNAFVIAVWIAIVSGAVVAIMSLMARSIFLTMIIAWYAFMNYQSWQYYREHGIPGD